MLNNDHYLPHDVEIIRRIQESPSIFTLHLRFIDKQLQQGFHFSPGQFNMLYVFGVGEIAISIASDPDHKEYYAHTIRCVGRVTKALEQLQVGDHLGLRGPYGTGWPTEAAQGQNVILLTGGLGCAPVVSLINYIIARRHHYASIYILQGVKHSDDFIFKQHYQHWQQAPDTHVYFSADAASKTWPGYVGRITDLLQKIECDWQRTIIMMCGPEIMMHIATLQLLEKGVSEQQIYLSMERNMECALGHCGHCQYGATFICKKGPVLAYNQIQLLFNQAGF